MEIQVRPMRADEITQIIEIERSSFDNPWPWKRIFPTLSLTANILVATADGRVVGYVVSRIEPPDGHILNLAVAPAFRRKGIATALMRDAKKRLMERVGTVYLEVRVGNEPAKRLYEGLSFRQVLVRRNYYSDGEDAIVMVTENPSKNKPVTLDSPRYMHPVSKSQDIPGYTDLIARVPTGKRPRLVSMIRKFRLKRDVVKLISDVLAQESLYGCTSDPFVLFHDLVAKGVLMAIWSDKTGIPQVTVTAYGSTYRPPQFAKGRRRWLKHRESLLVKRETSLW